MRFFLLIFLWAACPPAPVLQAQHAPGRPSDGLLERPDLQDVVDAQVRRDARALKVYLSDSDPVLRARAAFALASVQDSTATPGLLDLLRDSVATVRADAAFALGQTPDRIPSDDLLNALARDDDVRVRRLLIEALGKKGDAASLKRLVAREDLDSLRADVALAVGRFALRGVHDPDAVAYLLDALTSPEPDVRTNAAYYFGRTRDPESWRSEADAVRTVADGLDSTDTALMYLVSGLGSLQDPTDTPRLKTILRRGGDWRTQVNAVRALRTRTDEKGVRTLLYEQLVHPSMHVAVAAAEALNDGKAWPEEDLDVIRQWVRYNAYAWRITSPLLQGMARQDPEFVFTELARRRGSPAALVYAAGMPALGLIDDPNALEWLVNAAHHSDVRVAASAFRTLSRRWETDRQARDRHAVYFEVLAYGLNRGDPSLTDVIAPMLSDSLFRPYGAVGLLRTQYLAKEAPRDLEEMQSLLSALGATQDTSVVGLLRRELTHADADINIAAGRALQRLTGETYVLPSGSRPAQRAIDWGQLVELGPHPYLVLETERGTLRLEMDAEQAPLTTLTIAQFARMGFFDDVPFHRVVPNFVIQGGDFARGDGYGSPAFRIRSEFTRIPFGRGTLGMASSGKDTEGSQFFITHSMQPHLDGRYTAFGSLVEGEDALDTIYAFDRILHARVEPGTE